MPLDPKTVAKWTPQQWSRTVKMVRPSGGGAVGVVFVFTKEVPGWPIAKADFVVKPLSGSAANTQFAEHVLDKLANARKLNSVGIPRESPLGRTIVLYVENAVDLHELGSKVQPEIERLRQVLPYYRNAGSFVVQDLVGGMEELNKAYQDDRGLIEVLTNRKLMHGLGALYVADALLGNGDRMDQLNAGNIAFGKDGRLFAVDSTTILTSYEKMLKDATQESWCHFEMGASGPQSNKLTPEHWVDDVLAPDNLGGVAVKTPSQHKLAQKGGTVVTPPSARLKLLFNPPLIWQYFRQDLEAKIKSYNTGRANETPPRPAMQPASGQQWDTAQQWFLDGVQHGLHKADSMLGGLSWLAVRSKFKGLRAQQGNDPNFSWTNFKLRRLIVRAAKSGKSLDEARNLAKQYAERKFADL